MANKPAKKAAAVPPVDDPEKKAPEAGATEQAPTGDDKPEATPKAKEPKAKKPVELVTVDIVLKQDRQVGDMKRKAGEKIATVVLEPDCSIGYLARAIHDDFAGPAAK